MNTTTSKNSFGDLIRKMGISEEKEEPVKLEKPQPVSHNEPPKPAEPNKTSNSSTIIGSDVEIIGNIKTGGSIELHGNVQGNIEAGGCILLNGTVTGDIKAESVTFSAADLKGNASVLENIIVDEATTIVGDLSARSLTLDGQMNGKTIAEDTCLIKEHAVLNGNIQTRRIGVSQGAVLNGEIKTLAENK